MEWEASRSAEAPEKGQVAGRETARRRVVAIGGVEELCGRVARLWPTAVVEQVGSALAGLAYLGQRGAPGTVIVELECLGEETEAFVEALRRLAPRSRLIGWSRSGKKELEERAVRAGFDALLRDGMEERDLVEKLGWELPQKLEQSGTDRREDSAVKAGVQKEKTKAEDAAVKEKPEWRGTREETPELKAGWVAAPGVDAVLAEPVVLGEETGEGELGDVDLLAGMGLKREDFAKLLGRVIQQRTGWAVHLAVREEQELAEINGEERLEQGGQGYVRVPIRQRDRMLGVLEAQLGPGSGVEGESLEKTRQRLESWAAWAGCWLAMHEHVQELRELAFKDELTGAWNRRYFERFLEAILKRAAAERFPVTLMVYDIDDFKKYNDQYGHAAGDEILRETARLMRSVIRAHDVVARIGGDEFAVVFWDPKGPRRPHSRHPADVRQAARRFQEAVCNHRFPKLLDQSRGTLTISGGLASFPWDGRTAQELLEKADAMCLASKKQGKNVITFGPGALRAGEEEG